MYGVEKASESFVVFCFISVPCRRHNANFDILLKKAYIISTIMVSVACFVYTDYLLTNTPYLDSAPRIHRHLDVVGRPHVGAALEVR